MIAVIDYGAGNLKSVANALEAIEADFQVTNQPQDLINAGGIILPGVGAFGEGMGKIRSLGLEEVLNRRVVDAGVPFLGICLGLQFLASTGYEHGTHRGLGWIDAEVVRLEPKEDSFHVPHMGWNELNIKKRGPLFDGLEEKPVFYFVHSFHFAPRNGSKSTVRSTVWHGQRVVASVWKDNIFGVQFHPEKSQANGIQILRNFIGML